MKCNDDDDDDGGGDGYLIRKPIVIRGGLENMSFACHDILLCPFGKDQRQKDGDRIPQDERLAPMTTTKVVPAAIIMS